MDQELEVLKQLMDFGRFTGHPGLAALAAAAEKRYPAAPGAEEALEDEALEELFAAGDSFPGTGWEEKDHEER